MLLFKFLGLVSFSFLFLKCLMSNKAALLLSSLLYNIVKYYYHFKYFFIIWKWFINVIYTCDVKLNFQHHYSSFQCHLIFRNHYNMLTCYSRNTFYYNYQCSIKFCCLIFALFYKKSFEKCVDNLMHPFWIRVYIYLFILIADPKRLNWSAYPKLHICLLIIYTSNKIWISMGRNSTIVILPSKQQDKAQSIICLM